MKKSKKEEIRIKISKKAILAIVLVIMIAIGAYLIFSKQRTAKEGDTVLVNYQVSFNGTIFDTNIEKVARASNIYNPARKYSPINVTIGAGKFLRGFEDNLYGMKEGETKTFTVPPELAYGIYDPKKISSFPLSAVNNSEEIKVGTLLTDKKGNIVRVIEVNATHAIVDMNHILAGKSLTFTVTLLKII